MAIEESKNEMGIDETGDRDEEEKWATHYSSNHQILLVGEGDFSFSLSLANAFGSASNICASSLDSYDVLIKKYKKAKSNLENLEKLGASLLYKVDATKMKLHTDLAKRKFDRIIFNFPHAGFYGKEDNVHMIQMHGDIVQGFFRNARGMLRPYGEIHVSHKNKAPFCNWNLEELASSNSLALIQCVKFEKEDYPGYHNKRGDGPRCDEAFPLGDSSTFKFIFANGGKKVSKASTSLGSMCEESQHFQNIPKQMQLRPTSSDLNYSRRNHIRDLISLHGGSPSTIPIRNQYSLDGNLNAGVQTYQRNTYGIANSFPERMRSNFHAKYYVPGRGLERQIVEVPRTLNGDLYYQQELHHASILRSRLRWVLACQANQLNEPNT
ncbi:heavy metal-associated isoprenylated plant protein 41-like [Durio zibethinus]|uniref:Heavy metal-associated isoprenylated plant protein 41-like n=1 Tax=Durio zibethinus TaxID=66656 RepID=A0A6P5WPD4_DURZI|nr:heavy metal-associated isoprenylated plant protein 41-like [Durio zibethinus]